MDMLKRLRKEMSLTDRIIADGKLHASEIRRLGEHKARIADAIARRVSY